VVGSSRSKPPDRAQGAAAKSNPLPCSLWKRLPIFLFCFWVRPVCRMTVLTLFLVYLMDIGIKPRYSLRTYPNTADCVSGGIPMLFETFRLVLLNVKWIFLQMPDLHLGMVRWFRIFIMVDLPAPFGQKTNNFPFFILKETLFNAFWVSQRI